MSIQRCVRGMLARNWLAYLVLEPRALARRAAGYNVQRVWRGHQGRKTAFALWVKKVQPHTVPLRFSSGRRGRERALCRRHTRTRALLTRAVAAFLSFFFSAALRPSHTPTFFLVPRLQTSAAMFIQRFARHLSQSRGEAVGQRREAASTKLQRSWYKGAPAQRRGRERGSDL